MKYNITFQEIKEAYPSHKWSSIWAGHVTNKIALPISWLCANLGISANYITYLSILVSFTGAGFIIYGTYDSIIIGALLFNIYLVLDGADGNIARVTKDDTTYGGWLDNIGGYITYVCLFLSVGIAAEGIQPALSLFEDINFILAGSIAAIANILTRNQYQKFKMVSPGNTGARDDSPSLLMKINRNLGLVGFLTPVTLIAAIIMNLHAVLIFYTVYYVLGWLFVTITQILKVEKYEREN